MNGVNLGFRLFFDNDIAQVSFEVRQPSGNRGGFIPRCSGAIVAANRSKVLTETVNLHVEVRVVEDLLDVQLE